MKIALITSLEDPDLCDDDLLVLPELRKLGIDAEAFVWDERTDFKNFDALIFRSCWNYHRKFPAFLSWLKLLESSVVKVFNPVPVSRWNLHKKYLLELKGKGIPVPELVFVNQGSIPGDLSTLLQKLGTDKVVVKPAISLSGHETFLRDVQDLEQIKKDLAIILRDRDAILQAYVKEVKDFGEISLVYLNGKYSYALRKIPAENEFRVHQEYGGKQIPFSPPANVLQEIEKLIALQPELLFSRVDIALVGKSYQLIEWEIIDPMLYLRNYPGAAKNFAAAIFSACSS